MGNSMTSHGNDLHMPVFIMQKTSRSCHASMQNLNPYKSRASACSAPTAPTQAIKAGYGLCLYS